MNEAKKKTRRRYGAELKQQILAQCARAGCIGGPHCSVPRHQYQCRAQVAPPRWLTHCRVWICRSPAFVPVPLPSAAICAPAPDIQIELRRGATSVSADLAPGSAAEHCAAVWMRELIK